MTLACRRPAIFLDEDNTIFEMAGSNGTRSIRLRRHVVSAMRLFQAHSYSMVLVASRKHPSELFTGDDLGLLRAQCVDLLATNGVDLDGWYFCERPADGRDHQGGVSDCSTTHPGLVQLAAQDLRINLARSWLVGSPVDPREASCRTVSIERDPDGDRPAGHVAHYVATDLLEAALLIIADTRLEVSAGRSRVKGRPRLSHSSRRLPRSTIC